MPINSFVAVLICEPCEYTMAVNGRRIGRVENSAKHYSFDHNFKHCVWRMPGQG